MQDVNNSNQIQAATAPLAKVDPVDALSWGANVAEILLSIGRAIGFGRAQQILGEQWEAEHNCAPRGRMGVTVKDDAHSGSTVQDAPAIAPVVLPEPASWTLQSELDAKRSTTNGHLWFSNPVNALWTALYTEPQMRAALLAGVSAPAAQAVASIYVSADGQRECDDWKMPLPIGRNLLYTAPQAQADARDTELLDFLKDQCIDLRCFTTSDGEDVGWRIVQHHMGEPRERVVSEVCSDEPRRAIREAMARIERDPYCTGPLHLEDEAAIAAQAAQQGEKQ